MAVTTYGELKTAVADVLARSDLTSYIPDFIVRAETRIHYGSEGGLFNSEPLRIRAMETAVDLTINAETVALPTGYLESRRLYLNTSPRAFLSQLPADTFYTTWAASTQGQPVNYTIEGESFVFGPIPDSTYTGKLLYYKKFTAFSSDSDTNWLLTNAHGVYLYGALLEAMPFIRNDNRLEMWFRMFEAAVNGLSAADKTDRWSGSVLAIRSDRGHP